MPEFRLIIETGFSGADHEKEIFVEAEDWDSWDETTREQHMNDELEAFVMEEISSRWELVSEDDE